MKQTNNRIRLLQIMDAFYHLSDENHPLSSQDLIQYCFDHGISAERKAVYSDIEALREFGMDILFTRTPKQGFFLASSLFEIPELRLLIDAVQASSFISSSKSNLLIDKLTSLTSQYQAEKLLHPVIYPKNKSSNEKVFYTIDALWNALDEKRAISFLYFDLDIQKERKYRRQRRRYKLIPYAMIWENQRYYCIGYDQKHSGFSHYRIDKMDDLKLEESITERVPFDLEDYRSKVFGMYQGKQETVTLRAELSLVNILYDQFGQDILIHNITDKTFDVTLTISIAPTFISWLFQFDKRIEVLSPASLIEEIKKTAHNVLSIYDK